MAQFDFSRYKTTVIVTSDTCHKDPTKDTSGQYIVDKLKTMNFADVTKIIVADEKSDITNSVKTALEDNKTALIITVGGTGLCPRDVTPEATSVLYERYCDGITTALYNSSLRYSPHAALSRLTVGIASQCLIVNFPGKLKACKECFACLAQFLTHALEQIRDDTEAIRRTHLEQDASDRNNQPQSNVSSSIMNVSQEVSTSIEDNLIDLCPIQNIATETGTFTAPVSEPPEALQQSPDTSESTSISGVYSCDIYSQDSSKTYQHEHTNNKNLSSTISLNIRTESSWPLIDYSQALEILSSAPLELSRCRRSMKTLHSLEASQRILGEVLAKNVSSRLLNPPFPVSTMDGYVLNVPPQMGLWLSNTATIYATLVSSKENFDDMQKGEHTSKMYFCYQVNTGGRVPETNKRFAVVPFEKTGPLTMDNKIPIYEVKLGCFVRAAGSDLNQLDCLEAGTKVGPVELSLLLMMGHKVVEVVGKPVIGVLSTGDELVEPYGQNLTDPTAVYDCNLPLLTSLFTTKGYQVACCGIARDDKQDLIAKVTAGLQVCDILVITGGASMGTKDYVKSVIENIGGIIHFGRVNIKPGKPAAFGTIQLEDRKKFVFSLPGNPVSAYITATVLVVPFINYMIKNDLGSDAAMTFEDIGDLISVEVASIVDFDDVHKHYTFENRLEFIRATIIDKDKKKVQVSVKQQSSRLLSLKGFDCLLMIDPTHQGSQLTIGQKYKAIKIINA